MIMKIRMM